MPMKFSNPSLDQIQASAHLSDEDFFSKFPEQTHRIREWNPSDDDDPQERIRVALAGNWAVMARRDGYKVRFRAFEDPFMICDIEILAQPAEGFGLTIDYGPLGLGVKNRS